MHLDVIEGLWDTEKVKRRGRACIEGPSREAYSRSLPSAQDAIKAENVDVLTYTLRNPSGLFLNSVLILRNGNMLE